MSRSMAKFGLAMACLTAVLAAATAPGIWLDVPFVKQEKEGCGAASIAMVMQFWQQQQGRPVAEFPLTAGVVGALIAPIAAAIGAIVALLKDCTIAVERSEMTPKHPDSTAAVK